MSFSRWRRPVAYEIITNLFLTKMKHHICGRRTVLEGDVQTLGRQELDPDVPKSVLLDWHIIHVPKLVLM